MYKCPKCGATSKNTKFEMVTVYHNCNELICGNCGYQEHWMSFKTD